MKTETLALIIGGAVALLIWKQRNEFVGPLPASTRPTVPTTSNPNATSEVQQYIEAASEIMDRVGDAFGGW